MYRVFRQSIERVSHLEIPAAIEIKHLPFMRDLWHPELQIRANSTEQSHSLEEYSRSTDNKNS